MKGLLLDMAVGWAVLFSVFVLAGALKQTYDDVKASPKRRQAVAGYCFLWVLIVAGDILVGRYFRGHF